MSAWTDKQLAAAGIDKTRLEALVVSLSATVHEMEAMGLYLQFDETGAACLVHVSRPPFEGDENRDHGVA